MKQDLSKCLRFDLKKYSTENESDGSDKCLIDKGKSHILLFKSSRSQTYRETSFRTMKYLGSANEGQPVFRYFSFKVC